MQEKGNLSINSENFMPIIKKWLYTDKDIFIRELVSNACDAVTKLQKLSMMGEADIPAEETYEIHVVLDQDKKTLQIIDNGIGMTADEIKKYINQIAFSGATDFLSKFEGKTEDEGSEIIGHFGLGFYSAFMVADTVEIDSLSYQKGAEPAKWRCNGGIDYEMEAGERTERGTTITLFIGADGEEFLNEATLYAAMRKYCAFMPVPIFVDVLKEETEEEKAAAKKAENTVHVSPEEAAKLTTEGAMDLLQEQQDAAEEAKAEEPKPLNVSRSALQNDGYVEKMNAYITKKVADKLNHLFKTDRSAFEGFWDDINIFIKYGCMKEEKLYDKVKDILLLKTTDGVYETVAEYLEKNKEKHENVIYFATDTNQQAQYIRLFKEQGLEAAIMDTPVDKPFVSFLEYKNQDIKLKVQRVDADIDSLQEKEDAEISEAKKQADEFEANQMQELFRAAVANEKLNVKLEALKAEKVSAMILLSEESRRMMEMMEAYANNEEFKAMFANMKPDETLVLNKNNKLVKALLSMAGKEEKKEDATLLCHQLYDLALMSHRPLTSEEMTAFIDRSNLLLEKLTAFEA